MELWIRSQDKTRLIKINSLEYVEYQGVHSINGYYTNESDNYDLGVYSTKERALEVLDEIQNILSGKCILKSYDNVTPEFSENIIINPCEVHIEQLKNYVYNMPEN